MYIYTEEQFLEEWLRENNSPVVHNLTNYSPTTTIEGLMPPTGKQNVLRWAFGIPETGVDSN